MKRITGSDQNQTENFPASLVLEPYD